jgi:hypothetical protein
MLVGFKKRFVEKIENKTKRQTIRLKRKDGRNARVGDTLYLYVGLRTKSCRKLGQEICKSLHQIYIDNMGINIDGVWLTDRKKVNFAEADGFQDFGDMKEFFIKNHELPFEGLLYKW